MCGSAEVRRLSVIHQTGLNARGDDGERSQNALWKHAAPPVRKRTGMWTLLLVTSLVMEVATFATGGTGALAIAGVAIAAAVFSVRAASSGSGRSCAGGAERSSPHRDRTLGAGARHPRRDVCHLMDQRCDVRLRRPEAEDAQSHRERAAQSCG